MDSKVGIAVEIVVTRLRFAGHDMRPLVVKCKQYNNRSCPPSRCNLTVTGADKTESMSFLSVMQLRDMRDSLVSQYKTLAEEKEKLESDCKKLRDAIGHEVEKIKSLSGEFEKLRQEYAAKRGDIGTGHQQIEFDQAQNTARAPAPASDEVEAQDWEFTPLVPPDAIEHPLIVNLLAEIVDSSVICAIDFSPDGTGLAIGSDKTLRVYDIDNDKFLFEHNLQDSDVQATNHIRSICWTNDSKNVICGGEDGKVRVFSMVEKALVHVFEAGSGEVFQVCLSSDNSLLAVVSGKDALSLFRREDYSLICTMRREVDEGPVATALAMCPDDKIIAVGYSDSCLGLWDVQTHKVLAMMTCHDGGVYAVKWAPSPSPDRYRLVTASVDNSVKIWDVVKNEDKLELVLWKSMDGHSSYVLSLAIDPKGEWLLSGSKDLTARLSWLATGTMIYSIKAHLNSVITVAFSPKGNIFCTGSGDETVKIWSMTPEETEERA